MFKRILIPVDGSELSLKAAATAVSLAKEFGAEVVFLHVTLPSMLPYGADYAIIDADLQETLTKNAVDTANTLLDNACRIAANKGVLFERVLEESGRAELAIERTVKRLSCDLVVLATHGRGAIGRFVMGSVTIRLLSISPVPVLIYRDESMTDT